MAVGTFGGTGIFSSTADGETWEPAKVDASPVYALRGIGFGHGELLGLGGDPGGVGDSKPFVATSADGRAWSRPEPIAGKEILRRVCWGSERFVAVGDRGRRAASTDGHNWTDAPKVKAIDTLIDVAYGQGRFVGVGLHGLRMSSEDGVSWSDPIPGEEGRAHQFDSLDRRSICGRGAGGDLFFARRPGLGAQVNRSGPLIAVYGDGKFVGAACAGGSSFRPTPSRGRKSSRPITTSRRWPSARRGWLNPGHSCTQPANCST